MEQSYKGQDLPCEVKFKLRWAIVSYRKNGANTLCKDPEMRRNMMFEVTGEDMWWSLGAPRPDEIHTILIIPILDKETELLMG